MLSRLALVLAALALAVPAIALGSGKTVPPTAAQRTAILKAFGSRSKAQSKCMTVVLAASNHKYARVRPRLIKACTKYRFNGVNVFKNTTDNRWKQVFAGSDYKCPLANVPRQVQRDLSICK